MVDKKFKFIVVIKELKKTFGFYTLKAVKEFIREASIKYPELHFAWAEIGQKKEKGSETI